MAERHGFSHVSTVLRDSALSRPTETVDNEVPVEPTSEEYLAVTNRLGVKLRDFAYEPRPKGRDIRAPETWSQPLDTLVLHDRYIRLEPSSARHGGKMLWSILSTGLVTREEAEIDWRPEAERKVYNAYQAAYRKSLLEGSFHSPFWAAEVRPERVIYIPPDVKGMVDGPKNLPDSRRGLCRIIRTPPNPQYVAVYDPPEQLAPARSNPPPALSTPYQPRFWHRCICHAASDVSRGNSKQRGWDFVTQRELRGLRDAARGRSPASQNLARTNTLSRIPVQWSWCSN
ncbi:hypothetical protein BD311DRAFT_793973 [Dichomitus squalens]|uniref:Uncharacterized protein n=1 Tax=Dichomitus squalens TaxID=114155 RepID=A0A4Q9N329_9APHY|nr:hypothetical protein BD311DRAFT_793973 [Dichomitus squalens]